MRTVSPAGVQNVWGVVSSATPDDYFTASPDCRVGGSGFGRVGDACGRPKIRVGIVSAAGVQQDRFISSTPEYHFAPCPDCRVVGSAIGRVGGARCRPTIRAGTVFPAGVQIVDRISSAPDDHFTPSPHCCVPVSDFGGVEDVSRSPNIRAGIVSSASVQSAAGSIGSAPDDHFAASPHCFVNHRTSGALVVLVALQLSVLGLYLPPVFKTSLAVRPPQTIISLPVHTAVWLSRAVGA